MYYVNLEFDTLEAMVAAVSRLAPSTTPAPAAEQPKEQDQPTKRPRKAKAETTEAAPPAAEPPSMPPSPVVESPKVKVVAQAPVETPKRTQPDLIKAFRALAEAKGTNPIIELLQKYNAKSVALIPEASWHQAILDAEAATK